MHTGQQALSTALVLSDAGKRENGRWAYGAQVEMFDSEQSNKSTWRRLSHRRLPGITGFRTIGNRQRAAISNMEDFPRSVWVKHMSQAGVILDR